MTEHGTLELNKQIIKFNDFEGKNLDKIVYMMEQYRLQKRALYLQFKFDAISKRSYNFYMRRMSTSLSRLEHLKQSFLR